jgi:hypothetical protein
MPQIAVPPPNCPDRALALADAATQAYGEVARAAGALGLAPEQLDAVCDAVEAATLDAAGCLKFIGMYYWRLQAACAAGREAAARKWMEDMAARARRRM